LMPLLLQLFKDLQYDSKFYFNHSRHIGRRDP
jgi:hypothetical protein